MKDWGLPKLVAQLSEAKRTLMAARKELVANLPPPAPSVRTEVRFVEGLCKVKVHVEAREHEVPEAPSWILRAFERIGGLPM